MNELLVQFIPGALECRNPHYPSLSDAPHQSVPTSSLMVYNLQLLFWYKFLAWQKSGCPEQELAQVSLRKRGLLWIFTQQNCRKWKSGQAWWAAIYGVAQNRTRLKRLSSSSSSRYNKWRQNGAMLTWGQLFIHRAYKNAVPVTPDDLSTFPNKPRKIL